MFGGCDSKPSPMQVIQIIGPSGHGSHLDFQVCQGIRIVMMTKMNNIGSIVCPNTPVQFLDSGETEMSEEFVCSQAVTYQCVQEALDEARAEEGEDVTVIEDRMTLECHMDPHTIEYIAGWLSKKVSFFKIEFDCS